MSKEFEKTGSITWVDGQPYFELAYTCEGTVFKDAEAYEKDWDAPCYVPENAVSRETCVSLDGKEYDGGGEDFSSGWYSHNDLLKLCFGNREWCDYLFQECLWAFPETYIAETDDDDLAYFYQFAHNGAKVWWNDPAGETCGVYEIFDSPLTFDEHGELTSELDDLFLDTIIKISTGYSEAEVPLHELTPVYSDLYKE